MSAGSPRYHPYVIYRLWLLIGDIYFRFLFRKQWARGEQPHFFDHRHDAWGLLRGKVEPWCLWRGFNAGRLIQPGDVVLDIGCGDGFFTERFLGSRADRVDGIDIEPSAIDHARQFYPAPNVTYHVMDAVTDPFPRERYDLIVWDGALGHFDPKTAEEMVAKIASSTERFCGSESLGYEGHDHLQFFERPEDVEKLFIPYFAFVESNTFSYGYRTEIYWRCSHILFTGIS